MITTALKKESKGYAKHQRFKFKSWKMRMNTLIQLAILIFKRPLRWD